VFAPAPTTPTLIVSMADLTILLTTALIHKSETPSPNSQSRTLALKAH
jgi:hypothetical protein